MRPKHPVAYLAALAGGIVLTAQGLALPAAAQGYPAPLAGVIPQQGSPIGLPAAPGGGAPPSDALSGPSPAAEGNTPRSPASLKPLGLEQEAWNNPRANMGPRQSMPGFLRVTWGPDIVTEINVREGMLTVIKWPVSEQILTRELSDKKTFETRIGPDGRSIMIRSIYAGVDGNMLVYGSSGNVYNIYLRSIPYNSKKLPDTTVEMIVGGLEQGYGGTLHSNAPVSAPYSDYRDLYQPTVVGKVDAFKRGSREWAESAPLRRGDMDANIDILVPDREDQAIAPIRAWHDREFTYLDFGENAGSMSQWPVASLVVDGSESPVGTRTRGPRNSIMIVEAIGDIVLRNGRHMVCLKLRNQPDNRVSPSAKVAKADGMPDTVQTAPARVVRAPRKAPKPVVHATLARPAPVTVRESAPGRFEFDPTALTGKIQ
jgi:hypothetical protein